MNRKGFLLLNAMFASLLIVVPLTLLLGLIAQLNLKMQKVQNIIDNGGTVPTMCSATQNTCIGTPVICMTTQDNNKSVQICEGQCAFVSNIWKKGSLSCDQGVVFQ